VFSSARAPNGFDSGASSAEGSFSHSLKQLGTVYYWSPDLNVRGVIEVIPRQSRLLTVEAISNGFTGKFPLEIFCFCCTFLFSANVRFPLHFPFDQLHRLHIDQRY
jgi:hypothetical protein